MRKIIILPFAELDIRDSVNYYANKEEDLEKKYLKVINHAFLLISENWQLKISLSIYIMFLRKKLFIFLPYSIPNEVQKSGKQEN